MLGLDRDVIVGPVVLGDDMGTDTREAFLAAGITLVDEGPIQVTTNPRLGTHVRWMHTPTMGVDWIIGRLPPTVRLLTRTITGMQDRMASYVCLAVNAELWRWIRMSANQRASQWVRDLTPVPLVRNHAIIVGTGEVGSAIARTLRPQFTRITGVSRSGTAKPDFDVVYPLSVETNSEDNRTGDSRPGDSRPGTMITGVSRSGAEPGFGVVYPVSVETDSEDNRAGDERAGTQTTLLDSTSSIPWGQADAVVVTLPLTLETRGILGGDQLSQLSGAHLILVGRGATVDFDALKTALDVGTVRHATLDVFPIEPLPPESWLWSHPRVTLTPHICGLSDPTDTLTSFLHARDSLLAGQIPRALVDLKRGY